MSSQKGNTSRSRPQKHKNRTAFKNTLHDTSQRTKIINSIQVGDVCVRCKEIIEWKIKYKKYKPLTQPRTCVKCGSKAVKQAYHVMCSACGKQSGKCTKCCQSKTIVEAEATETQQLKLDNELKDLLKSLPERKRRTFLRYMNRKEKDQEDDDKKTASENREDLLDKLNTLKLGEGDDDFDDFLDEEEDEDSDNNQSEEES
ncbi:unnamed protein product [Phaedon cochleariae]|uniref:Uncharacterized protein n=1 Tax=Phaedon cochleariae TaxID=80249 RepID=A0A9P0DQM3_PHACE|nr:unnamed protein product [Phaedon cochleariae]